MATDQAIKNNTFITDLKQAPLPTGEEDFACTSECEMDTRPCEGLLHYFQRKADRPGLHLNLAPLAEKTYNLMNFYGV